MVNIDKERCIGCGSCVSDCVALALVLNAKKAQVVNKACLLCGHCVAICPKQAVEIDDYDMTEVVQYDKESFAIDPETFRNHIKFRRSIRHFTDKDVERDKIERILDVGRFTPTGSNQQDVRFTVVRKEMEAFKEMVYEGWRRHAIDSTNKSLPFTETYMGYYEAFKKDPARDRLFFHAPVVIVVSAQAPIDAGLASANMESMAVAEGLGVLYNGWTLNAILQSPEARQFLDLRTHTPVAVMMIGYPAIQFQRTAPRKKGDIIWR